MSSRSVSIIFNGRDNVSGVAGRVQGSLRGINSEAKSMIKGLAGAAAGLFAVSSAMSFASGSLEEFLEAEEGSRKLNLTLKNLGDLASVSRDQIDALAASIHQTTVFEDDAAIAASRLLLNVRGLTKEGFERALKASTDLAAMTGRDLPSAAEMLAKALVKPESGMKLLRSAGVLLEAQEIATIKAFAELGDTANAQASILYAVSDRVSGSARDMAETTRGQLEQMKKDWNDLKEWFGKNAIAPVIRSAMSLSERGGPLNKPAGSFSLEEIQRQIATLEPQVAKQKAATPDLIEKLFGPSFLERQLSDWKALLPTASMNAGAKQRDAAVKAEADMEARAEARGARRRQEESDRRLWDRPATQGMLSRLTDEAMRRFAQFGGLQNQGKERLRELMSQGELYARDRTKAFEAREAAKEKLKEQLDARKSWGPAGSLGATESRFLTRGTGALDPQTKELVENNKLARQQLKEQKETNTKLDKWKGGMFAPSRLT